MNLEPAFAFCGTLAGMSGRCATDNGQNGVSRAVSWTKAAASTRSRDRARRENKG